MKNFFIKEINHFRKLSQKAQRLLVSYFFVGLAGPLIGTFVNAYIFINQGNLEVFVVYYLGFFLAIPLTFIINGWFLRRVKITYLYFFGTIMLAVSPLLLVFYANFSLIGYFIYGFILGIGVGFHWGNRNYFNQIETVDHERSYYFSITYASDTVTAIFVSFLAGWLIVFGLDYKILMMIAFVFLFISASIIISFPSSKQPETKKLFIKNPSNNWIGIRALQMGIGIGEGIAFFFGSLIILSKLGNEGILGTLSALTSLIAAISLYIFGRKSKKSHQIPVYVYSLIIGLFISLLYGLFFNKLLIVTYVLFIGSIGSFIWLAANPISMDALDRELKEGKDERYSYILDAEIFLNIGRSIAVLISLLLFYWLGTDFSLRYSPVILYAIQMMIMIVFGKSLQ